MEKSVLLEVRVCSENPCCVKLEPIKCGLNHEAQPLSWMSLTSSLAFGMCDAEHRNIQFGFIKHSSDPEVCFS